MNDIRLIDANVLLKRVDEEREYLKARGLLGAEHILVHNFRELVENAPTVEYTYEEAFQKTVCEQKLYCPKRPQGKWFENIDKGCLKARHGNYVLYQVDFLLDNLAREVTIMENVRRMKGDKSD